MMEELLEWLQHHNIGVGTLSLFCEKALALRAKEPEHAALARLLASLAGDFAKKYFGEPLLLDVAEQALARLTSLLEKAVRAKSAGPAQQLALLNEIAMTELD
jgi:hypothetical protein